MHWSKQPLHRKTVQVTSAPKHKCTGAVVGQQPFGGARALELMMKAGSNSTYYAAGITSHD
jgi:hypothetical protein